MVKVNVGSADNVRDGMKFYVVRGNEFVGTLTVVKTAPASAGEIQAISGATITSRAVTLGVNSALDYWRSAISGKPAPAALKTTDATSGASEKKKD